MSEPVNQSAKSTSSSQSSILQPRLRDSDLKFISVNMFGEKALQRVQHVLKPKVPGSNIELMADGTTLTAILFDLRRGLLSYLFLAYSFLLRVYGSFIEIYTFGCAYIWSIVYLAILNDDPVIDPLIKRETVKESPDEWIFIRWFNQVKKIPQGIRKYALMKSLQGSIPNNESSIRIAIGNKKLPNAIGIIFDMFPLVIPPPPEVPTPYLNADKEMIIPSDKEVNDIVQERNQWNIAQHTHKASEILRICSEAAKVIAWCSSLGIGSIICHEMYGYAWKNLDTLISLVQVELHNLDKENDSIKGWQNIRFVNVDTKEVKMLDNPEKILPVIDPESPDSESISLHSYRITVFLTSAHRDTSLDKIKEIIQSMCEEKRKEFNDSDVNEIAKIAEKLQPHFPQAQLVIKYTSTRMPRYSISGFPITTKQTDPFAYISSTKPVSFPNFARSLAAFVND